MNSHLHVEKLISSIFIQNYSSSNYFFSAQLVEVVSMDDGMTLAQLTLSSNPNIAHVQLLITFKLFIVSTQKSQCRMIFPMKKIIIVFNSNKSSKTIFQKIVCLLMKFYLLFILVLKLIAFNPPRTTHFAYFLVLKYGTYFFYIFSIYIFK